MEAPLLNGDRVRCGVYPEDPTRVWIEFDEIDQDDPEYVRRRVVSDVRLDEIRLLAERLTEVAADYQEIRDYEAQVAAEKAAAEQAAQAPVLQLVPNDDDPTGSEG